MAVIGVGQQKPNTCFSISRFLKTMDGESGMNEENRQNPNIWKNRKIPRISPFPVGRFVWTRLSGTS